MNASSLADTSSSVAFCATNWRNVMASLRNLPLNKRLSSAECDDACDSGKADCGTTPYFSMMATIISHWPPSCCGVANKKLTSRSVVGLSAVAKILL